MSRFRSLPLLALLLAVAPLVAAAPGDKDEAAVKGSPLAALPLRAIGPASLAQYDPPWTLWFMRRNEVMLPVAP